jgi:hypothetical protein
MPSTASSSPASRSASSAARSADAAWCSPRRAAAATAPARPGRAGTGEPWLRHALSTVGLDDLEFVTAELTLARESPRMIPLDLGPAEDRSMADALSAIASLAA